MAQTITVSKKNAALVDIFKEINQQTGYEFLYDAKVLALAQPVDIDVKEATLKEVLGICFEKQRFTYTISEKTIVVKSLKTLPPVVPPSELVSITGKVTDAGTQQPMPGVNIFVKGTTKGTNSDAEGRYSINIQENETLVFSFIGFKTFETPIDGRSIIDIAMEEDIATLDEITVSTGYWETEVRLNPGNIAKVSSEEISRQPVTNPILALQGRVAGVTIVQSTGLPGAGGVVQIRGRTNVNPLRPGVPLYIVDGVPYSTQAFGTGGVNVSPLNSISPADIESIEVLKDADATAIYGSRGANGVILITTKKSKAGKAGNTSINISFSSGVSQVGHFMDLLNTAQYLEMRKEALKNNGSWPLAPSEYTKAPDVFLWDTTRYTDWQKKLIGGTASIINTGVSLSGGSSKTQFLFSGNYNKVGSVFPGDFSYQRASGLFNVNHTSENEKFKFALSANYNLDINELPTEDLTRQAIALAPTAPALFTEDGSINWENNTWQNPIAAYLKREYRAVGDNLITSANFNYEVLPGLQINAALGYNKRNFDQLTTIPVSSVSPNFQSSFNATSTFVNGIVKTWNIEPRIEYNRAIGKGTVTILAGTTFQETKSINEIILASGFSSDAFLKNIKAASNVTISSFDAYQYRYTAVFGRVNYNLKDTYILNLTARRDGSSRFGPGNQFGNFGALGAAWIFSNEGFIKKNMGLLSFGKLRASYGITGSDNIGNYQYLDSYKSNTPYQGTTGLVPTRMANDDYGWETTKKMEAGLELGLMNDRIFLSTSFYRNRSSNQLISYPLPVITGQSSVQRNQQATVQNTGWEFVLKTENLARKVIWTTDFNLTIPQNKLIEYPDLENSPDKTRYVVGEPVTITRGYRYTGVDPLTGYYTVKDLNEDGVLNIDDYVITGNLAQKFFLGMNNSIRFKSFQVDFLWLAVKQTGKSYLTNFGAVYTFFGAFNQPSVVMNRWTTPGDVTDIQKFGTAEGVDAYINLQNSDRALTDASYIRLKNVQVSYQLPVKWISKAKIKNANLYVQGQNLLTFTKYIGLDPESQSLSLPPLRTITVGLQMSF
jgi:TonB-linked SusC/RagA family outer membrane protein